MFLCGLIVLGLASTPVDARLDRLILEERFSEAFGEAVDELNLRLAARGYRDPETIAALHRVGVIAHLAGDQSTAEDVLRAALDARREVLAPSDPAIAETLIYRGRSARYRNERGLARRCYDEAAQLLEGAPSAPPELRAQLRQAEADWQRGVDLRKAIVAYREALAIRRAARAQPDFAAVDNLAWLAWTLNRAGQRGEAKALAIEARSQLDLLGLTSHSLGATLDNLQAEILATDGKLSEAVPLFRTTAAIDEAARGKQLGGYSRRGFPLDGYEALALDALSRGRGEEAWTLLERTRAASHVDFATLARWSRRDPLSWKAWQQVRDALKDRSRRLAAVSGRRPAWTSGMAPLFVEVLELRARAYDLERQYLDAFRPRAPALNGVQALLGPKDALVGWLEVNFGEDPLPNMAPQRSQGWAYVLRKDRPLVWVALWNTKTPQQYVDLVRDKAYVLESLRRAASWRRRVDPDPDLASQLRAWGKTNFDPLLPHLAGVEHVVLEGMLAPLELARLADGRSVGEAFDVSYVPSALVYALLTEEGAPRAHPATVLAVSGPSDPALGSVLSLVDMDEAQRSQRELRTAYRRSDTPLEALPRLRHAALEAEAVGAKFPRSVVLVNPISVERTLSAIADRGDLTSFSVVHIAAHTLTDNAPERCALALGNRSDQPEAGDGLLEVEDILLGWQLDAELMTLSGCETLRAAGAERGEPFGFTPALFASGARRVLSSIWTVDDRATTILMDRFYENFMGRFTGERLGYRATPLPAARALREAKTYVRTLTDAEGRHPFEHPAYWAGFLLVGSP
jgi:CHAT domain-containing protein/tetratricopeptide (TPR) repeat protein